MAVEARAFDDVAGEVRGDGSAATVAAHEDVPAGGAGVLEPFDGLVHFGEIDGLDRLQEAGLVTLRKSHKGFRCWASTSAP